MTTSATTARCTVTLLAAASVLLVTPATAQAREPVGRTVAGTAAYSEPLDALGGRCLAQYLADHQARALRGPLV